VRPAIRPGGSSTDDGGPRPFGTVTKTAVRHQRSRSERPSGSPTDRSCAAPARRGAERSTGPARLVGGAQQPRSRRLCGGRRHAHALVGPRLSPALPGRRPLKAMARQCCNPGDRRRSTRPPRRNQRPRLRRGHLGGCQPAAQAARPPAPASPRHTTRADHPPGDDVSLTVLPSGHAASASAFATGVATAWPEAAIPLSGAAMLVAYSRVHTGVHYPVDVIAGDIVGTTLAQLTAAALGRRLRPRSKS
jgi:PAP2 superfamily